MCAPPKSDEFKHTLDAECEGYQLRVVESPLEGVGKTVWCDYKPTMGVPICTYWGKWITKEQVTTNKSDRYVF